MKEHWKLFISLSITVVVVSLCIGFMWLFTFAPKIMGDIVMYGGSIIAVAGILFVGTILVYAFIFGRRK